MTTTKTATAKLCIHCGMVGNVDPWFHAERYGHEPVIILDGVRMVHQGDGSFLPETYTLANEDFFAAEQDRYDSLDERAPHDFPEDFYEPPSCSICDGLGHGYPGGPPCPLEMRGHCDCSGRMAADGSGCMCGGM